MFVKGWLIVCNKIARPHQIQPATEKPHSRAARQYKQTKYVWTNHNISNRTKGLKRLVV